MFDENFSFLSSTADPITVTTTTTSSADISPFTSRCSSPRLLAQTSRDSRFDTYKPTFPPRHPSITALTAQLESHINLTNKAQQQTQTMSPLYGPPSPASVESDPYQDRDQYMDEGFYDSPSSPSTFGPDTPATDYSYTPSSHPSPTTPSDLDPTLWDLSMSNSTNPSYTSSPRPSLSLEAQALSSYTMRRRQRQALVRLQCLAKRTPDLAMLIEECHPSSLPLQSDIWEARGGRRKSSVTSVTGLGLNNGYVGCGNSVRVEKERSKTVSDRGAGMVGVRVGKEIRVRKRLTR